MFVEVRSNVNIAGVKLGGHSVKLLASADDTYFFTLDINSLRLILNTCDKFLPQNSVLKNVKHAALGVLKEDRIHHSTVTG